MPTDTPTDVDEAVPAQRAARIVPVPTIRFADGTVADQAVRIDQDDSTLGRSRENGYVVADPKVSRVHARLQKHAGTVIITDLGSSGGTTVNGHELEGPQSLHHGDTVAFNGIEGRFEDPAGSAADDGVTKVFELPSVETGPGLSPRQQQVLERIAEGMTNKEIGAELGISERTVKAYAQELYDKLNARNRAGAVAEGVKHGLL